MAHSFRAQYLATSTPQPAVGQVDGVERYRHPVNGHIETVSSSAGHGAFWIGPIYFASRGLWAHAAGWCVAAVCTVGVSCFIYPFFARRILRQHFLQRGYTRIN